MTLAVIYSRASVGIDAPEVRIEVHLTNGLPGLAIVGMPETAVRESKDRVRSALINAGFEYPQRRITVNLAPADLPKEGGRYDLAIALGVLAASSQIPADRLSDFECYGELSLSAELRPVSGILPAALACAKAGRTMLVPSGNGDEASLPEANKVMTAAHLLAVTAMLHGQEELPLHQLEAQKRHTKLRDQPDLADVKGQFQARRALEIAAAGNHHLLLVGPPGTGKTLLASRLGGILPKMSEQDALEVMALASVSGRFSMDEWGQRPFRSPHHTASGVALVGGGSRPKPGEISLAHNGILFLDELPEYDRRVLEVLREPLESGEIHISRATQQVRYPSRFQLVAAMNPCPCGYFGDNLRACRCTAKQVRNYQSRLSGPLLDRIDLQVAVTSLPPEQLANVSPGESSQQVQARVTEAHQRQLARSGKSNAQLTGRELDSQINLQDDASQLLQQAMEQLGLSPRSYHRILKVARTIADLAGEETVGVPAVSEALGLRQLDRYLQQLTH
ncbi:YifB family Mg chelatase-like AAA ATPase [Oceanospirillum linum]|uniref:ATP-dependent protease n=1 Tax=Oceanospirillum linum TaxID=966 RepID=A0A1T1H8G6_OCELI|nr:YifB family Mg chelatase-like AAA ATPase [Oceanospirillum linum]OOV86161.1 ATP-dependent protease [Oceanospirillum linum]SEG39081.1 magnesium chelatase family protein [Oleiphilus messinensis]SMP31708.1 magnesium chelatase family protein [Oceanospirillum linum]